VANLTVGFGTLLILLGVGTFAYINFEHATALIPAYFGVVLGVCGILARKDHLRKHVMHVAVVVGLIGAVMGAVRVAPNLGDLLSTGKVIRDDKDRTVATVETLALAVICTVFTGLCVKSFIDARRARQAV